jgi:hypothetical protein
MDVHGGRDDEGRNIIVWRKHGKLNQQWELVYADEWKGEPGKGEMNEQFGLLVDTDFYIQTEMKSTRYIDLIESNKLAIKTRNGRSSQLWYFHQPSLTIRSRSNNQSFSIFGNGGQRNVGT